MWRSRLTLAAACALMAAPFSRQVEGQALSMLVHTWTDNPAGVHQMLPGDRLYYRIGVDVVEDGSNSGLATIVYDIRGYESVTEAYLLDPMTPLGSGYTAGPVPVLNDVTQPLFVEGTGGNPFYNGGWGFDTGGFPTGGNATQEVGSLKAAGILAPLNWIADVDPAAPGYQPIARLGIGHGVYTFPEPWPTWPDDNPDPSGGGGDPILHGLQGGFGMDLSNVNNPIEGDGTWVFHGGVIDTSSWSPQTYHFDVAPTNGHLFKADWDFTQDWLSSQYKFTLPYEELAGTSFSFTLVPEPGTLVLLGVAAAALLGRRR